MKLTFRNMGANDDEFIKAFNERFRSRRDDIYQSLPDSAELESITDTRRDLFTATYDISPPVHDDIFIAYLDALQQGFEALVIQNESFVNHIDEAFESALDLYR